MKSIKKLSILALFACLWLSSQSAIAKIADCPAIYEGDISYRSHSNFVEASRGNVIWEEYKWDRQNINEHLKAINDREILWHTALIEPDKVRNYHLEGDVQANITCIEYTTDKHIIVSDRRNRRFTLDKETGKLLKTEHYTLFYDAKVGNNYDHHTKTIAHLKNKGDYLIVVKNINYINHSSLTIYKKWGNYDILLNTDDGFYLLVKQKQNDATSILKDFEDNKNIDINHWQKLTNEQIRNWYEQ